MSDIVVCCTDGSDISVNAIEAGLTLLDLDRWQVKLVICVPEAALRLGAAGMAPGGGLAASTLGLNPSAGDILTEQERLIDMGQTRALDVAKRVGLGPEHVEVLVGSPGPTVVDYLREKEAGLVLLGAQGLGGAARLFLGSVSEHLVRHAPCPVVVGGEDVPNEPDGHVVVCVDGSEASVEAGKSALGLFAPDLPIAVATVAAIPDLPLGSSGLGEAQQRQWAAERDRLLTAAATGLGVPDAELIPLEGGDAALALVKLAQSRPVRVFVIGTHGRGAVRRALLGSVAERLLRQSPALVCVVRRH